MIDFINRNLDSIIIVIISVMLSFLLNNLVNIIKTLNQIIKNIRKKVKRFIKKTVYNEYTLSDIITIQRIPKEQRTEKQRKALEKAELQMAKAIDADKMHEIVKQINSIGNKIGRL